MAELGPGQIPMVMPSYPHMLAEDIEVWTRFLQDPVKKIERVWYDVHVGQEVTPVIGWDLLGSRIAGGVSRKRIDVVAKVKNQVWVVEVKPLAGFVALGQVKMYHRLFVREYRPRVECVGVVVCGNVDPDVVADFRAAAIVVISV